MPVKLDEPTRQIANFSEKYPLKKCKCLSSFLNNTYSGARPDQSGQVAPFRMFSAVKNPRMSKDDSFGLTRRHLLS
jgi:hypothetical protein